VAENGGVVDDADIAGVKRLLRHFLARKVKGAGHMIAFDDFAGSTAAVDNFLAG